MSSQAPWDRARLARIQFLGRQMSEDLRIESMLCCVCYKKIPCQISVRVDRGAIL